MEEVNRSCTEVKVPVPKSKYVCVAHLYELLLCVKLAAAVLPVAVCLVNHLRFLFALIFVPFLLHQGHPIRVILRKQEKDKTISLVWFLKSYLLPPVYFIHLDYFGVCCRVLEISAFSEIQYVSRNHDPVNQDYLQTFHI